MSTGWGQTLCELAGYASRVLLSDRDIRQEIELGRVRIEPFEPGMIQPSSIDVRLDRFFRTFENHRYPYIDPRQEQQELTRAVEVRSDEPFVLHPGEFVLGSTYEVVTLPDDLAARVEGKSSLGRLGLLTHATAGFVDPGFSGHVTLELSNVATLPIMLWPEWVKRYGVVIEEVRWVEGEGVVVRVRPSPCPLTSALPTQPPSQAAAAGTPTHARTHTHTH